MALSDAEKLKRGTLDARWSQEGRGAREAAKVLAFPIIREMPEPSFPLQAAGQKTFDFWCKKLMEAGLLTTPSLGYIENLALSDDAITAVIAKGRIPAFNLLEARRKNLQWLDSLNVDTSVIAGEAKKGAFAAHGFPNRLRSPSDHLARHSGSK